MNPDTRETPALGGASGAAMVSRRIAISHDTVCGIQWIITAAGCVAGQGFIGFVGVVSGFLICAYLYPKSPNATGSATGGEVAK